MKKNVLIEIMKIGTGFGAHAPHYPGCVATGGTLEETRDRMLEALGWHIREMLDDGVKLPLDSEHCEIVEVKTP